MEFAWVWVAGRLGFEAELLDCVYRAGTVESRRAVQRP